MCVFFSYAILNYLFCLSFFTLLPLLSGWWKCVRPSRRACVS